MVRGGKVSYLNISRVLALSLLILLPFQNCGQDLSSDKRNSFTGDDFDSSDCLSDVVDCGPREEFLQISIDIDSPVSFKGLTEGHIIGRCNSGNYPQHLIYWEIRNPATAPVSSGTLENACVDGYYSFMANISAIPSGLLYSVFVKIIGVDSSGERYQNVQANGTAEVEFSK